MHTKTHQILCTSAKLDFVVTKVCFLLHNKKIILLIIFHFLNESDLHFPTFLCNLNSCPNLLARPLAKLTPWHLFVFKVLFPQEVRDISLLVPFP